MNVIRIMPIPGKFKIPSLVGAWLESHGIRLSDVSTTWVEVDDEARQIRYQERKIWVDETGRRHLDVDEPFRTVVVQLEGRPLPLPPVWDIVAEGFQVSTL